MKKIKSVKKHIESVSMVLIVLLAVLCLCFEAVNNNQAFMTIPFSLHFEGEYSYDGKRWYTLEEGDNLSALKGDVTVRGHFSENIEEGCLLTFYRKHIGVSMYVNQELVYLDSLTEVTDYGAKITPSMCAKGWDKVQCPKISCEDLVEFRFINYHKYGNERAYKEFINSFHIVPDDDQVLEHYLKVYINPLKAVGEVGLAIAIMLIGAAFYALFIKSSVAEKLMKIGFLVLFVSGYILSDIIVLDYIEEALGVKAYGRLFCIMFALYFALELIRDMFIGKKEKILQILMKLLLLTDFAAVIAILTEKFLPYNMELLAVGQQLLVSIVMILLCLHELLANKENKGWKRMTYITYIILFLLTGLDVLGLGYHPYVGGILFKTGFLLLFFFYLCYGIRTIIKEHHATAKNLQLEKELEDNRIAIMLTQIRPHFLYNVIGTIRGLCRMDPERARIALGDFANYLRGNMNLLTNNQTISFAEEVKHVEAYLSLEKIRMGEKLNIIYDIQEKDFYLPPLSVQPLVENAIKHGLFKKEGGGTLILTSRKEEGRYIIEVIDDGVGCEINENIPVNEEGAGEHIALVNVRLRLEKMVGGKLIIESVLGKGTKSTIILEEDKCKKKQDEYTGS